MRLITVNCIGKKNTIIAYNENVSDMVNKMYDSVFVGDKININNIGSLVFMINAVNILGIIDIVDNETDINKAKEYILNANEIDISLSELLTNICYTAPNILGAIYYYNIYGSLERALIILYNKVIQFDVILSDITLINSNEVTIVSSEIIFPTEIYNSLLDVTCIEQPVKYYRLVYTKDRYKHIQFTICNDDDKISLSPDGSVIIKEYHNDYTILHIFVDKKVHYFNKLNKLYTSNIGNKYKLIVDFISKHINR